MTSEPRHAFVWVWLPGETEPVVTGRLDQTGEIVTFTYGQSYLARADAIPLYVPELPLQRGRAAPLAGDIAGCIADAGPDAWGQRVILNRLVGAGALDTAGLHRLTYLLESGSDRIGALDFQVSATDYVPRTGDHAPLDELARAAEQVEQGVPLSPALDRALLHGGSIGGARPKALLHDGGDRWLIAKFSSSTDSYPVVKGEFVAWDGNALTLTPAYDICPQPRASGESAQIMAIGRDGWRMSQVAGCVERAATYLLSERDAREIVDHQVDVIETQWDEVCDAAALSAVDRAYFWRRQLLNPYALEGYR